ncbi:hypothetical protein BKI52_30695 [marine bacterium AO1-C]|nr:hypothetical protein BKI52_30695 [marine bacterium AO1-C]
MNTFYIQNQQNLSIPEVTLDAHSGKCTISGNSYMEDTCEFYQPILDWIMCYTQQKQEKMWWDFKLGYYNSSSKKNLANIIDQLGNYQSSGGQIEVNWYYHADDLDMLEDVEDFMQSARISINTILYPSNRQETMFFKQKISKTI